MILTEQMVISHLGTDYKRQGAELVFQCPVCNDKGKDNLKYNTQKNVLECFADNTHSKAIYAQIMKENKPEPIQGQKQWERESPAYYGYVYDCNQYLLSNDNALNYLYEHTLINPFTVKNCEIGYDNDDKRWVFPIYDIIDGKLKGFEYRAAKLTEKKIWKEKDTPACLAHVFGKGKNKKLYICEGFKDAYILAQWLDYNPDITIMTPSNGVGSLENVLPTLELGNFKIINLCLDNDPYKWNETKKAFVSVGQDTLKRILELYPFMVDKTPQFTDEQKKQGLKDVSDLYKLKMEGNNEQKKAGN